MVYIQDLLIGFAIGAIIAFPISLFGITKIIEFIFGVNNGKPTQKD